MSTAGVASWLPSGEDLACLPREKIAPPSEAMALNPGPRSQTLHFFSVFT